MAKERLWDFFDGEPFMDNPRLGILSLNTPRKRGSKKGTRMAKGKRRQPAALRRYWAMHRKGGRKRSPAKRRTRARKNWITPGLVAANPKRRRTRSRSHRVTHRRKSYRRNPAFLGLSIPPIREIGMGVAGFAAPALVPGFLQSIAPSVMQTVASSGMIGKYAIKVGSVAILSYVVHRFVSARDGNAVMIGGGINIGLSLFNDFAPGFLPANPLGMYVPTQPGMRMYTPTRPGLRGPVAMNRPQLPSAVAFPTAGAFGVGTAARYKRY